MPNGSMRSRELSMIGTWWVEVDRERWPSPLTFSVCCLSVRWPISRERSSRSRALEPPPRMSFTIAASQIAVASFSPHTARAWASDWSTTSVEMPVPPPSDISEVSEGSG